MNPLDAERLLAANEIYAKVVALARDSKDDDKLALALHAQGHSYVLSEELEAAEKAFDESREISSRLGDKRRGAAQRHGPPPPPDPRRAHPRDRDGARTHDAHRRGAAAPPRRSREADGRARRGAGAPRGPGVLPRQLQLPAHGSPPRRDLLAR